ncbi:hypothetical protein IFM89_001792 [Coptis chinensis]|uniref:Uncharacterized protein n=1 Tax=Coptis chinensis TaxID=261450 RepID=A0A835LUC6_9MAGN|nr:hypothetical protein IFM89_001792 [Coptis chinensis]
MPHPYAIPTAFAPQAQAPCNKPMPFIAYLGVAMWQFMPPAVDTSQIMFFALRCLKWHSSTIQDGFSVLFMNNGDQVIMAMNAYAFEFAKPEYVNLL